MPYTDDIQHINAAILTVSDRCFLGRALDKSGPLLKEKLESSSNFSCQVVEQKCCMDCVDDIQDILKRWCNLEIDLILTTGGTGLAQRDVTPEAVQKIMIKEATGIALLIVSESLKVTSLAALSRPVCGIIGHHENKSFVITLPGSCKAASECLEIVSPVIKHAIDLLRDNRNAIESAHEALQNKQKSKADVCSIAFRDRKSPYIMIDVDRAIEIILSKAFLLPAHSVELRKAVGFALVEEVFAKENLPPFPASIKDGYAVIASDGEGERAVIGQSCAGIDPNMETLSIKSCVRINTGAPIPEGADAVVQVEDTELLTANESGTEEILIRILKAPSVDQDIRKVGSDITKGQSLFKSKTILGPPEIGVLASAGVSFLEVFEKPKVSVLSTGNELQSIRNEHLKTGFIYDSNKETIISLLEQHSFPTIDAGIAVDDPTSLMLSIQAAFEKSSVLVTSGSVSMGERDILRPVLIKDFGATIHFAQVFMKPGKPTTFASCTYKGKPKLILGLPGNPVSAMVTSHLYLLPLLKKMSGFLKYKNTLIKVKLANDIKLDARPEYHRSQLIWQENENLPRAHSTGNQISSRLLSFDSASALLKLPPASQELKTLPEGSIVSAIVISI